MWFENDNRTVICDFTDWSRDVHKDGTPWVRKKKLEVQYLPPLHISDLYFMLDFMYIHWSKTRQFPTPSDNNFWARHWTRDVLEHEYKQVEFHFKFRTNLLVGGSKCIWSRSSYWSLSHLTPRCINRQFVKCFCFARKYPFLKVILVCWINFINKIRLVHYSKCEFIKQVLVLS